MKAIPKAMMMEWSTKILLPKFPKIVGVFLLLFGILFSGSTNKPFSFRSWTGVITEKPSLKEKDCLIESLYHEARGEPEHGIRAVANVILNRKQAKGFPGTICGVVHQPYAFSYRNHLAVGDRLPLNLKNAVDKEVHAKIESIAQEVVEGKFKPVVSEKTLWYAQKKIKRKWMKDMKIVIVVGEHKFLEMKS